MTGTRLDPASSRKGRPRDERIDREVTSAALLVLADTGFTGFSVAEVAARTGVAKTTIYRRFPTRDDLILGALERLNDDLPETPGPGTVRDQLIETLEGIRRRALDSARGRILMQVMGEGGCEPALAALVQERVLAPRRRLLSGIVERGIASGELRPDLDLSTAIPVLVGPMVYLGMWHSAPEAQQVSVANVVDLLMAGMTRANAW